MGNVALDVARILSKTEDEFAGSDIVTHALDALRNSRLESVTKSPLLSFFAECCGTPPPFQLRALAAAHSHLCRC